MAKSPYITVSGIIKDSIERNQRNEMKDALKAVKQNEEVAKTTLNQDSLRKDLDAALRHLHLMSMQTKYDMIDVTSRLFALIEELVANGQLDLRSFEERRLRLQQKEEGRLQERAHVLIDNTVNKYELKDLPQIDCKSRLDLCKGRCCRLTFPLSFQDLDESIVKWNYSNPYLIRHKDNDYCMHHDCDSRLCLVYKNRPATCRTYDCRNDKRIWIDFERRIPAPEKELQEIQDMRGD